jgi:8-oxo-dGTP pyrophosphatase MutT (NUDIX family)
MKQAVCLLFPNASNTLYLAVSRRDSLTQWGLVGGKVDDGETHTQAIVRETFEEVGLTLNQEDLKHVHTSVCEGEVSYEVTTFEYTKPVTLDMIGTLEPEEGLTLRFISKEELCNPANSPFSDYNKRLFAA